MVMLVGLQRCVKVYVFPFRDTLTISILVTASQPFNRLGSDGYQHAESTNGVHKQSTSALNSSPSIYASQL
jgi:hypothetical protein